MNKLESIEKLREWADKVIDSNFTVMNAHYVKEYCDEIQAEIDSRFMELPVDADGVPIHVGDELHGKHKKPIRIVIAVGNGEYVCDCAVVRHASLYHHVKPRTVEDVLLDFLKESRDFNLKHSGEVDEAIKRYSAELQMRGDAE